MPPSSTPLSAAERLNIGQFTGELLPYASELFGVYQPLLGWRSARTKKRFSAGLAQRLRSDQPSSRSLNEQHLAPHNVELTASIKLDHGEPFSVRGTVPTARLLDVMREQRPDPIGPSLERLAEVTRTEHAKERPAETARTENAKPLLTPYDFLEAKLVVPKSSIQEILSPVGILHLFREYFFELPTFLGNPVGHVWVSPGGTVELVETSTRKISTERTTEYATEISTESEKMSSEQDEVADAARQENINDQKLGVTATGSGGIGVVEASASASFSLQNTRKQSQEVTHKRMREQTQKYSTKIRENFKTTFRTVTETTDTSSRRYVLSNPPENDLINYELRRKMRRVAVQIQHLGDQLCWQLYLDNPGRELGIAEFLPPIPEAAVPTQEKGPELIPDPGPYVSPPQKYNIDSPYTPIVKKQSDGGYEKPYGEGSSGGEYRGFHPYFAPDPPQNYQLHNFSAKATNPFQQYAITPQGIDGNRFQLTQDSAHPWSPTDSTSAPFDITFEYRPTDAYVQYVNTTNEARKAAYALALGKKDYVNALRGWLENFNDIREKWQRPSDDLRSEERTVVVKKVMDTVFRNFPAQDPFWDDDDWHTAADFANRLFDLDRLLYFVSPQWFRKSLIGPKLDVFFNKQPASYDNTQNARGKTKISLDDTADWGFFDSDSNREFRGAYLVTEKTHPAPMGASLGWLIQLDADERRNAFLNSPWVKVVIPIRRSHEREALEWLSGADVEGGEGLKDKYKVQPGDPTDWKNKTLEDVLNLLADAMNEEYDKSITPAEVDFAGKLNKRKVLPAEKVFEHGFDPLDGGFSLGEGPYEVFSQWTEILPTDQVVAIPYNVKP